MTKTYRPNTQTAAQTDNGTMPTRPRWTRRLITAAAVAGAACALPMLAAGTASAATPSHLVWGAADGTTTQSCTVADGQLGPCTTVQGGGPVAVDAKGNVYTVQNDNLLENGKVVTQAIGPISAMTVGVDGQVYLATWTGVGGTTQLKALYGDQLVTIDDGHDNPQNGAKVESLAVTGEDAGNPTLIIGEDGPIIEYNLANHQFSTLLDNGQDNTGVAVHGNTFAYADSLSVKVGTLSDPGHATTIASADQWTKVAFDQNGNLFYSLYNYGHDSKIVEVDANNSPEGVFHVTTGSISAS